MSEFDETSKPGGEGSIRTEPAQPEQPAGSRKRRSSAPKEHSRQFEDSSGRTDPLAEAISMLDRINAAVKDYDEALRERAATILVERAFGDGSRPAPRGVPTAVGQAGSPTPPVATDFASLVERWTPATQPHWALLAAYYQTRFQAKDTATGQEINSILKHHGTVVRNITDALGANMTTKPALVLQVAKSGSSRQARKAYKVTTQGIQFVERMLRGPPESPE